MPKFFRICGVIFFLGVVVGACLLFSSAGSGRLADALLGIAASFFSAALGLLFIYVAELLDRIAVLEKNQAGSKPEQKEGTDLP